MTLSHVRIIGAGLIGTSIGLALRAQGVEVTMADIDPAAQKLAQDLMGSIPFSSQSDVTVIASPISTISEVIKGELSPSMKSRFIDISSVKVNPQLQVLSTGVEKSDFLPSHPMAGREVGGAESA